LEAKKAWTEFLITNGGVKKPLNNESKALKNMIRKYPVPAQYRAKVWMECSGASKKILENEGYYEMILNVHAKQLSVANHQIEMDLARTFPTHPYFNTPHSPGRDSMRRILIAYSWRNPLVGMYNYMYIDCRVNNFLLFFYLSIFKTAYCQSLNYIVALLLLFYTEEQAFWMLVMIMEDILPANFYSPQLKGLRVDGKVFDDVLNERVPKLFQHFMEREVDSVAFISGWWLRLYVDVFPIETTLRIWDLFFNEGSKILFRVALSYLKMTEVPLLAAKHVGEVLHFLNENTRFAYDHYTLAKVCLLKRRSTLLRQYLQNNTLLVHVPILPIDTLAY